MRAVEPGIPGKVPKSKARSIACERDNYIAYLGDDIAPLYEVEILKCLGAKRCDEIDDSAMAELIKAKLPKGDATPATLNRHLYRPVMAGHGRSWPVMAGHGLPAHRTQKKAPMLQRPKGHSTVKPVEVAKAEWVPGRVAGAQSQTAGAGQLPGIARPAHWRLGRRPKDLNGNVLVFGKTLTVLMTIELERQVLALICAMPGWRWRKWLFPGWAQ